ncbi:MAG: N-acetylmuramoyl-L-alanine amidase [Candidatus Desulforudis sp.]|nr:N-acetylmuramoyl-L-alanine amidase [Desulforudis sp.]
MSKKLLFQAIIVCCFCFVSMVSAGLAIAQTAVVKGNVVNLRSGPGTGYAVIGEAKQGDRLSVLDTSGEWSKISRGSLTGWIHSPLITVEAGNQTATGQTAVVTGSTVRLRAGAGTSHPVVGEVPAGTRLPVLGKSGDWLNVLLSSNKTAWVAGWLVRVEGSPAPAPSSAAPTPAAPSGTLLPPVQIAVKIAVVTAGIVNVRASAGVSYPVVTQVNQGTRLAVVGGTNDWVNVKLNTGQTAWIARSLVRLEESTAPSTPQNPASSPPTTAVPSPPAGQPGQGSPGGAEEPMPSGYVAVVKASSAGVREGPGVQNPVMCFVFQGERFPVLAQKDIWRKITLSDGRTGWVATSQVNIEKAETPSRDGSFDGSWTLEASESGGRTQIVIKSPVPFEYNTFTLSGPSRLVIDLFGVPNTELPSGSTPHSQAVSQVRVGWQSDAAAGRVVCDLAQGLGLTRHRVEVSPDRKSLKVELWIANDVLDGRVIVIDPGHGGADPGATGPTGYKEKDFNLQTALETARLLRQEGVEVILTRTTDIRLGSTTAEDLDARSRIANQSNADLFVSIHANANLDRSKHGTSLYYHSHPENHVGCAKLARALQASLVKELGRKDLGIFDRQFLVLKNLNMPGALVETAFLSNHEEERLLAQDWFQNRTAIAIVDGIKAYYNN